MADALVLTAQLQSAAMPMVSKAERPEPVGMMRSAPRHRRKGLGLLLVASFGAFLAVTQPPMVFGYVERLAGNRSADSSAYEGVSTKPGEVETLHPGLVAALERARSDAAPLGLELPVASGFRSIQHQLENLDQAVAKYGTREEAEHWVFPPERSMHVRGLAIDIGDGPSADWMLANGSRFGICKTLAWEWWHFEWRESWERAQQCPAPVESPEAAPPPDGGW